MTKVLCAEHCGNSPRKLLIKKLLTALARGENGFILRNLREDITWERVGDDTLKGREAVSHLLDGMKREPKAVLSIDNIVTHGGAAAANGTMTLGNGKTYAFCHVYTFVGAKDSSLRQVTEYLIQMQPTARRARRAGGD